MSRLSKLIQRERQTIVETLEKAQINPASFTERDIERLKACLADLSINSHIDGGEEMQDHLAVNNYLALCVTSTTIPFIDVDTGDRPTLRQLQSELGGAGLGGRVYRTRKGYRLALNQEMPAKRLFSVYLPKPKLEGFGIDKSYALFCTELGNYRARCTAKPWRIARKDYSSLTAYERYRYPVLQFVENFGVSGDVSDHWQRVMQCHDAVSHCVTGDRRILY